MAVGGFWWLYVNIMQTGQQAKPVRTGSGQAWRRLLAHKYRAKKSICNAGCIHPSRREANRCDELHLLQRAGEIRNLELQPKYEFVINGERVKMANGQYLRYTADFQYFEGNQQVTEDVKGMITADFRIRRALFLHLYPKTELRLT